ncbi:MAG: hypothetical protein JF603_06805 [Acidobacteria bacterium]|nr:hypothetical protein [Acidobacteriota bacterium]
MTRAARLVAWAGLISALSIAVAVTLPRRVAAAADGGVYSGVASADGVRLIYGVKGFVIVDTFADLGAPTAQVSVSPIESVGFASLPYPGETALSAPGLVSGQTQAPVPDYPLIARSQYPSPEKQSVGQGPVKLSSESTDSSSSATAVGGGDGGEAASVGTAKASASSVHDEKTGSVTSIAMSDAEAFTAGGVFHIGRVLASASVTDAPGSEPKRKSDLAVTGVTIAGQTVGLTPAGFVLPGTTTPLPDSSPLVKALADHGITVHYLAAEETPTGVIAPGIEVEVEHPVPTAPQPGVATYRFGRAAAFATGAGGTAHIEAPQPVAVPSSGSGSSSAAAAVAPSAGAPVPYAAPAPDLSAPVSPTAAPGGPVEMKPVGASIPQWDRSWITASYLLIALAGAIALGGAQLIRLLGVRMPWSS